MATPFGGNGLGEFVYLRSYSRWLPEKGRRERWEETVDRTARASIALYSGPYDQTAELELMKKHMLELKQFPAGRSLWIGGTEAAEKFGLASFNCAFRVVDDLSAFTDTFHCLMVGAGVGVRILPDDIKNLPTINPDIVIAHKPYYGKAIHERIEVTQMYREEGSVYIIVGDSKEG